MSLPHAIRLLSVSVIAAALLLSASRLRAVDGDARIHDPSTIIQADGNYIRLVQLDPRTGKRLHPERKPVDVAINSGPRA